MSLDRGQRNEASLTAGVFVDGLNPSGGGAAAFASTLIEAITGTEQRHKFILFYKKMYGFSFEESIPMVDIERDVSMGMVSRIRNKLTGTKRAVPVYYAPLEEAIKEYGVDILWFLSPTDKIVSIPSIYAVWDLQHRVNPLFPEVSVSGWGWDERERTYSLTLPRATRIFTGTKRGKEEIVHFYRVSPDVVEVIPFPVPSLSLNADLDKDQNVLEKYNLEEGYLFYPGQFWPHKNHANLLMALDILRKKYSIEFQMVFAGGDQGNEGYIREMIERLKLKEFVNFLGYVPGEDLIQLYRSAFALVFPTFFGPDNLPPLEAFALGCPVIASKVEGADEQLGDAAMLFDPKSPEEIASVIKRLYESPELKNKLVKKGRSQIKGRSAKDYIDKVNGVLDDLERVRRCWK